MDDFEKSLHDQRELLDSLNRRIKGESQFVDFDKLNNGTFMSRYYLTNCLEQGWLNHHNTEIQSLIIGWAREYPEFMARMRRKGWFANPSLADEIALEHACRAPHRYVLHFLLEGWIDPENPKVKELIILTLNEGNSNIYLDRGWLTQEQIDDILDNYGTI